jgi:hypothetical protein
MPAIASTSGRLHSEFVRLLFLQAHRETDRFFAASGVQLAQSNSGLFHFRRAAFSSHLKSKIGNILAKAAALRVNLNLEGAPITSRTHTHPSHSQTSRLLTSSLPLGVPVPRATQCMRGVTHQFLLDYSVFVVSGGVRTFFTSAFVADVTVRRHTDTVTLQAPSFPDTVGVMWECCLFVGLYLKSMGEKNIF